MYTVEHHVGRLLEVRIRGTLTEADVKGWFAALAALKMPAEYLGVADYRGLVVLAPAVADGFVANLRKQSAQVIRSGLLLPQENATLRLQMERIIRDAGIPTRRCFHAAGDCVAWLGEVATPEERARLQAFLAG